MTTSIRTLRTGCGIVMALLVASSALAQPFAYVSGARTGANNRGTQVLTVIDVARRAKVASIPLGESCLCVGERAAVSADGARVYVSNYWSNTVSVIDTATNSVIRTFAVQPFPGALAPSPDGSRLYINTVLYPNPGYLVQVLDTASGATIANIPLNVPQSGSGMAISPDGRRLFVTNQALNGSNVKIIDTATNAVIGTVTTGSVPRAIDITPDGQFAYVAVQEAGVVSVINTATGAILGSVPAGTRPLDVRVLQNGSRVYSVSEDRITAISTTTGTSVGTIPITLSRAIDFTPDNTTGIVAADGRVHVLDTGANAIVGSIPFDAATDGNPIYVVIPRAVPPAPEAPTGLTVASIVGNAVTLRWTPPAAGSTPTGYVLEGGISPGEVAASLPTGGANPSFTVTAPTGAFYVRIHATGLGGRSPASNEIRIFVNMPTPPSPPADLLGLVNGTSLALTWRNTFEGGAPASVVLDVSGSLSTSVPLGLRESFAYDGVPPGTYTFSVHGVNSAGVAGPNSNPVTLTFPGPCSGAPQSPANFVAYRVGRTIFVLWDPPSAGAAPTGYVVSVTGSFSGSAPTSGRSLSGTVGAGTYALTVAATNACGTGPSSAPRVVVVP
ncbi:MAG TPA: beta-propeller fold lactonase family protein [Vicinamibacterales bacterium]|nr:beta-propeller fold lactonase family protein [Vicinamibacterales bacterium]